MSATTAGAVKAWLEGGNFGIPFFRDRAPAEQALPFGVVQDGISVVPVPMGDTQDQAAERVVEEQIQVAIYEEWRNAAGKMVEQYALPDNVEKRLRGAVIPQMPKAQQGCQVLGRVRQLAVDGRNIQGILSETADQANVVATIYTVVIRRVL